MAEAGIYKLIIEILERNASITLAHTANNMNDVFPSVNGVVEVAKEIIINRKHGIRSA